MRVFSITSTTTVASLISSLFFVSVALAAGGGGGGSGGSSSFTPVGCSSDTWTCSEWSVCSQEGKRTRACDFTTDCAGVETPKPATSETCVAPVVEKKVEPAPVAPPAPAPVVAPAPAPEKKEWKAPAATPAAQPWKLKCFNLKTLRARIDCRLGLSEEDLDKEIWTKYLPEECRSKPKKQQAACVELYKKFQPCWEESGIAARMSCAREVIGMSSANIGSLYGECRELPNKEKIKCQAAQREKIFVYTKFKFYDLSEFAEVYLEDKRVSKKVAVDFITLMETKKQQFNAAGNNLARKWQITKDVRAAWPKFLQKVKFPPQEQDQKVSDWPDDSLGEALTAIQDMK